MWVLGIKPRSFGRAASALNHWAISPALDIFLKYTSKYSCSFTFLILRMHLVREPLLVRNLYLMGSNSWFFCFSLSQRWAYSCTTMPSFVWVLEIWAKVPMLAWQTLSPVSSSVLWLFIRQDLSIQRRLDFSSSSFYVISSAALTGMWHRAWVQYTLTCAIFTFNGFIKM